MSALNSPVADEGRQLRRRLKNEAHLTSGCGYGKAKQRLNEAFWATLWPSLELMGWTKVEGTGPQQGSIYFLPKGVNIYDDGFILGQDYYDRLRDVIDYAAESGDTQHAYETFDSYLDTLEDIAESEGEAVTPKSSVRRSNRTGSNIDLSWKDGGNTFPKASSRVGEEYQAPALPEAGTFSAEEARQDPDLQYDQVWDPERATEAGVTNYIEDMISPEKRESALQVLHDQNYIPDHVDEKASSYFPVWTEEEKERFHAEMFRLRKDIVAVAKATGLGVNACYAYYLGKFKKSNDYRLLKAICEEERGMKISATDQGLDVCGVCGDGGSLLICDGCEGEYHMTCLRPPLLSIPEGFWLCDSCIDSRFLEVHDGLLQKFYEKIGDKRKADDFDSDDSGPQSRRSKSSESCDIILKPSDTVLEAVKELADCFHKNLT